MFFRKCNSRPLHGKIEYKPYSGQILEAQLQNEPLVDHLQCTISKNLWHKNCEWFSLSVRLSGGPLISDLNDIQILIYYQ